MSIHSSCLLSSRGLQVVHNRGHGYSNSLLTLQGRTSSHACHHLSPRSCHPSSGGRTWMKPRHYPHIISSNPGDDYLSLAPLEGPAGSTKRAQIMQGTETPPLPDGFTASQVHPHIYMMQPFPHSFSMHMPNGKPESSGTPGPDRVCKEAKRGSHKSYMWSYSLSWITKQELGA